VGDVFAPADRPRDGLGAGWPITQSSHRPASPCHWPPPGGYFTAERRALNWKLSTVTTCEPPLPKQRGPARKGEEAAVGRSEMPEVRTEPLGLSPREQGAGRLAVRTAMASTCSARTWRPATTVAGSRAEPDPS
jgi:hypothetical protein